MLIGFLVHGEGAKGFFLLAKGIDEVPSIRPKSGTGRQPPIRSSNRRSCRHQPRIGCAVPRPNPGMPGLS